MIRAILSLIVGLLVSGTAIAQGCGSYPYTLTNGTTADASQVMANFNYVLNCTNNNQVVASLLRGWLAGLTMKNDDTSPTTVIDTSAGVANSDDATTLMSLSTFTKNANAAWAVGSGNGCLDSNSGTTLTANSWYNLYVIARTDSGIVDQLCTKMPNPSTVPVLPTNYTKQRRIGSFKTDGSAHVLGFVQNGDTFLWKTPVQNVSSTNPGTNATLRALAVPTGVRVKGIMSVALSVGTVGTFMYVSSPDQIDVVPSASAFTVFQNAVNNSQSNGQASIWTDTSAQVRTRFSISDANVSVIIVTNGWEDPRGRTD